VAEYDFDLFSLGAGSGGVAASRRAASYGAKVAICESTRVGGTCVLRGCVPKKLFWYASHLAKDLRDAPGYGWSIGASTLDWGKLTATINAELDRLNGIYLGMLDRAGVTLIEGRGKVIDAHTVEVDGKRYTARRILVATGGWPEVPSIPGAELGMTSNEALDLERLPKRIAIVGGGYIAVEFAGIFGCGGADVTMVLRSDVILRGFDVDVRSALRDEMVGQGIEIKDNTQIESIEKHGDALRLRFADGAEQEVDAVLWATGRAPNTANIGLEEVGVRVDARGAVEVDSWSCTSVPSIFAIGDCTTRVQLTPVAIADGRALVQTLYNNNPIEVDHENIATAVFSDPPVGTVGLTEAEARASIDGEVDIYRTSFRPMKHVLADRKERVMMKLIVERETDRVVGAHMVGMDAPEIVQAVGIAMKAGATKRHFDTTVGIHPTSAEEFTTMFERLEPV